MREKVKVTIGAGLYIALAAYILWIVYPLYWYYKVFGVCSFLLLIYLAIKTVANYRKEKL